MAIFPALTLLCAVVTASLPAHEPLELLGASAGTASQGVALLFSAAHRQDESTEPRVVIADVDVDVGPGDAVEYALATPEPCAERAGVALEFADGRRLEPPEMDAGATWRRMHIALDTFHGTRIAHVELATAGARAGEVGFRVAEILLAHADGSSTVIFHDALAGHATILRDDEHAAGVAIVDATGDVPALDAPITGAHIREPWAVLDLKNLRRIRGRPELDSGHASVPHGLVFRGPCVPLEFAPAGEPASIPCAGERISFEPLAGGRCYTLWLAIAADVQRDTPLGARVFGPEGELRAIEIEVPSRSAGGFVPRRGDGFAGERFALLEVPISAGFAIRGIELFDDPKVRIYAASLLWHRDGPSDPHYRLGWIEHEVRANRDIPAASKLDVERWLVNRRVGPQFADVPGEIQGELRLFNQLQGGLTEAFVSTLASRMEVQRFVGEKLARLQLAFVGVPDDTHFDRTSYERASASGIADLRTAIAAQSRQPALRIAAGMPRDVAALAEVDPAALTAFSARVKSGRIGSFAAPFVRARAFRGGGEALTRSIRLGISVHRSLLGDALALAAIDGELASLVQVPQLLASAGVDAALVTPAGDFESGSSRRWRGIDGSTALAIAPLFAASDSDAGSRGIVEPDRIASSAWRDWLNRAHAGRASREALVPFPVGRGAEIEAASWIRDLASGDVAPHVRVILPSTLAIEAARAPAGTIREWTSGALEPFSLEPSAAYAPASFAIDDALTRAVRTSECALLTAETFGAIARADGFHLQREALAEDWKRLVWLASEARPGPSTLDDAERLAQRARAGTTDALAVLAHAAVTTGAGLPIVAFNPLPWSRRTIVSIADPHATLFGADKKPLLGQGTSDRGRVFEVEVPALGWSVLHARTSSKDENATGASPLHVDGWRVSNDALSFRIDPASGDIVSVRTHDTDDEVLAHPATLDFNNRPDELRPFESVEIVERGPVRAVVRVVRSTLDVRVTLDVVLEAHARRIDFHAHVESLTGGGIARATFAPIHGSSQALAAVPFGVAPVVARTAASEFAERTAREWPLREFAVVGDGTAGLALVNASATRFAFDGSALSIVLNTPGGGRGARDIDWSLLPFTGPVNQSGAAAAAAERAQPIVLSATDAHDGARAAQGAYLRVSRITADGGLAEGPAAGVLVSSFQSTDEGDGWLVRLVEQRGETARLRLEFDRPVFDPQRVDLLGNSLGAVKAEDGRVELALGPWRIETLRVRLRP